MIPTGLVSLDDPGFEFHAQIVLGPDVVTTRKSEDHPWTTHPLSSVRRIEWDDYPFQPEGDEIAFLQQWVSNLSPDALEAAVEAQIGENGMHRQGEWIKAALLQMVPQ